MRNELIRRRLGRSSAVSLGPKKAAMHLPYPIPLVNYHCSGTAANFLRRLSPLAKSRHRASNHSTYSRNSVKCAAAIVRPELMLAAYVGAL